MLTDVSAKQEVRDVIDLIVDSCFLNPDIDRFASVVSDERYIQHNPHAPDGKKPMIDFLGPVLKRPVFLPDIKHVLVDGDIGVVFCDLIDKNGDHGGTIADMFRIEDGKVVEHWDVMTITPAPAEED